VTAVVRSLFRTTTAAAQTAPPAAEGLPVPSELGGDCLCGRGAAIGTCIVTSNRLMFRAFHESPAAYHLERVTSWACVDCVADAVLDVSNGVVRERMREQTGERAAQIEAIQRQNEMRRAEGLPEVRSWIPEGNEFEWPTGGER